MLLVGGILALINIGFLAQAQTVGGSIVFGLGAIGAICGMIYEVNKSK